MKILLLIIIMFSMTSCFTQMNITKAKEPISEIVLRKMKPGKIYHFHFKDEYIYQVKIEDITDSTVVGKTKSVYHEYLWRGEVPAKDKIMESKEKEPFVYGYPEIQEKASKITTRRINPFLTSFGVGGLIAIGVGIAAMAESGI